MQNIKKYFMTLALLLTAVTGAWAQSTEPTEWELTSQDGKVWTLDKMPASDIELQVEYYAESNLFLGKEALANKANISVLNGSTAVTFDDAGKSANTVTEGNTVTVTYTGTKKIIGVKAEKKKTATLIVTPVVGQIIGSDGKNYDANATLPDGVTAVAMIAYVGNGSDCTNGLAIQLNANPEKKNWNDAKTYASGLTAVPGGTWRLPSEKDWQYMFIGCGSSGSYSTPTHAMEKSYSGLASKLTTAQGAALQTPVEYWSSSEYEPGSSAWLVLFDGSSAKFGYGFELIVVCQVRACLAF
jgi:hypothetical protein